MADGAVPVAHLLHLLRVWALGPSTDCVFSTSDRDENPKLPANLPSQHIEGMNLMYFVVVCGVHQYRQN